MYSIIAISIRLLSAQGLGMTLSSSLLPDDPIFVVEPEWIDYNGHMNMAYYLVLFDRACDVVYDHLDIGADYRQRTGRSCYTLEARLTYLRELKQSDRVKISFQLLDHDAKRLHFYQSMYRLDPNNHPAEHVASAEMISLHVDIAASAATPFVPTTRDALTSLAQHHHDLPRHPMINRPIGLRR